MNTVERYDDDLGARFFSSSFFSKSEVLVVTPELASLKRWRRNLLLNIPLCDAQGTSSLEKTGRTKKNLCRGVML